MSKGRVSLIVAMARNRVIGSDNGLPWHLPEDLKRFKAVTMGKPVIMGRKTFQSIETRLKKPLPGRFNTVISRGGFSYPGVDVFPDLETALFEVGEEFPGQEILILGGASVYAQALPVVERMYLTLLDLDVCGDAVFPEFNAEEWEETARETHAGPPAFSFVTLDKKMPEG